MKDARGLLQVLSTAGKAVYMTLQILHRYQGGMFVVASVDDLAELTVLPRGQVGRVLGELLSTRLIDKPAPARYRLLTLPRPWLPPKWKTGQTENRANTMKSKNSPPRPGHPGSKSRSLVNYVDSELLGQDFLREESNSSRKKDTRTVGPRVSPGAQGDAVLRALTAQAFRRLGVHALVGTSLFSQAFGCARKLAKREVTKDMMMAVVTWALRQRANGNAFPQLLNLVYLWGKSFPTLLANAQQPVSSPGAPTFRTGKDAEEWDAGVADRVRRAGDLTIRDARTKEIIYQPPPGVTGDRRPS